MWGEGHPERDSLGAIRVIGRPKMAPTWPVNSCRTDRILIGLNFKSSAILAGSLLDVAPFFVNFECLDELGGGPREAVARPLILQLRVHSGVKQELNVTLLERYKLLLFNSRRALTWRVARRSRKVSVDETSKR